MIGKTRVLVEDGPLSVVFFAGLDVGSDLAYSVLEKRLVEKQ